MIAPSSKEMRIALVFVFCGNFCYAMESKKKEVDIDKKTIVAHLRQDLLQCMSTTQSPELASYYKRLLDSVADDATEVLTQKDGCAAVSVSGGPERPILVCDTRAQAFLGLAIYNSAVPVTAVAWSKTKKLLWGTKRGNFFESVEQKAKVPGEIVKIVSNKADDKRAVCFRTSDGSRYAAVACLLSVLGKERKDDNSMASVSVPAWSSLLPLVDTKHTRIQALSFAEQQEDELKQGPADVASVWFDQWGNLHVQRSSGEEPCWAIRINHKKDVTLECLVSDR